MTKADLVNAIIKTVGFSNKESTMIVDTVFELMKTTLVKGEQVKISGFETFNVRSKNSRMGRNPQTGDSMELPARNVLKFTASPVLKKKVNGL